MWRGQTRALPAPAARDPRRQIRHKVNKLRAFAAFLWRLEFLNLRHARGPFLALRGGGVCVRVAARIAGTPAARSSSGFSAAFGRRNDVRAVEQEESDCTSVVASACPARSGARPVSLKFLLSVWGEKPA